MNISDNIRILSHGPSHFVGFHDLTPWNSATNELVCLRTNVEETHAPTVGERAEVVIFDENGKDLVIGETSAWNWQKAARQRFLPPVGRRVVAYNFSTGGGFGCRLVDLDAPKRDQILTELPQAIYDFASTGAFGLAVDMGTLVTAQPGYGYAPPSHAPRELPETGVWLIEVSTGKSRSILPLRDFLNDQRIDPSLGLHYFTHLQISPDSSRVAVLHRCYLKSGGLLNNLVIIDIATGKSRILHDDKVSHYDWESSTSIIVWCRKNTAIRALKESRLKSIVRPLYHLSRKIRSNAVRQSVYNEAFRRIDVTSGKSSAIGRGILVEDGHPQVHPSKPSIWISDTYPTPDHEQTLYLFDNSSNRRIDIATLATQPDIQETIWRCDFHPRWKPSGDKVCFDSAHLGRRQVCTLDVSAELEQLFAVQTRDSHQF